jgi:hypothetical protein
VVARRRALKHLAARLPGRPLIHFLYLYLVRGGFRDGYPGLMFCSMLLANQFYTQAKVAEAEHRARSAPASAGNEATRSVQKREE